MRGEAGLDQLLQLGLQRVVAAHAVGEHDERLEYLAAQVVGPADNRDVDDRRVGDQDALDVERADAIPGHDDDVVVAGAEEEVALGVEVSRVAGEIPTAVLGVAGCGLLRGVEVSGEPVAGAGGDVDRDLTSDVGFADRCAGVVDDSCGESGHRLSHRAGDEWSTQVVGPVVVDEHSVLGLAVVVADLGAQSCSRPNDHIGGQRFARRRCSAKREAVDRRVLAQ